ncbi:tRNA (N(6)-L-threonylcarbamoyladenosine(37)-C(2))-methylthiotransferase MtaB [Alphaproteobacteria bacterium]|nr:tRNA (N(6)-L-threonylcarbamoyladenosine(37)-C(2))-methylthiotransferase MtaB [Alphaproteobacteria bacterium]
MSKSAEVITFGCRLNLYESEVIKKEINGLKNTFVFNTCAVTSEAERQARQAIRKKNRLYPDANIVVTGCSAQIDPLKWLKMPEVKKVLGNKEKLLFKNYNKDSADLVVNDIMSVADTAGHFLQSFENKSRAFLEIQNGCNHRCTFCIIPFARGNSRSVSIEEIISEIKLLCRNGFSEVVLTGVDIGDYGSDTKGNISLSILVKSILDSVPNLHRLRLSSIDPKKFDDQLIKLIANQKRILPYFHLSVQSGDNIILKRMKRRHTREDVIELCSKIRKVRPDAVFGADFIAGFPTETDSMFNKTFQLIKECELAFLHIFPYSVRSGTAAARMPQIINEIKKYRASQLRKLDKQIKNNLYKKFIGTNVKVLVEKNNIGRTEHYIPIKLIGNVEEGKIIESRVVSSTKETLIGEI